MHQQGRPSNPTPYNQGRGVMPPPANTNRLNTGASIDMLPVNSPLLAQNQPKIPVNPRLDAALNARKESEYEKKFAQRYNDASFHEKEVVPEPFILFPMQATNIRGDGRNRQRDYKKGRKNQDDNYRGR
uniref:Uncharacterized protein n=1 Tax=Panagrellus redivivus TaxID=6233 RepID=A0A7E4VEG6_PANRE